MVTVGTGVGGGIVSNGKLFRGAYGIGGELGHMLLVPAAGCAGAATGAAWRRTAAAPRSPATPVSWCAAAPSSVGVSPTCATATPDKLTGAMVTTAALEGDVASIDLLAQVGNWLGEATSSMASLLDPEGFVIGGGVADAGELLSTRCAAPMAVPHRARAIGPSPRSCAPSWATTPG